MADSIDWSSLLGSVGSMAASIYSGNKLDTAQENALRQQQAAAATSLLGLVPYSAIGTSAANALATGDYTDTTLYKTGLSESEKAINRALANRGQYGSGGAATALSENAQNYNTNYTNTLGNLAKLGLGATTQANSITNSLGNASAASTLGQTQTKLNTLGSLLSNSGLTSSGLTSTLSGLGSLAGSAGSSLLDWYNNQQSYGNTVDGQNVTDWYNQNYGSVDSGQDQYYSEGESSDSTFWDLWS